MSIKATFTTGSNSVTVAGLYQWDIGQVLEIESADIGTELAEVHFACPNMNEAIVHLCTFTDGVGSVNIPDECLEQSSPITAWIYRNNDTQGYYTSKTITLPITARTRPGVKRDITPMVSDKYTELIAEVNGALDALENGSISVAKAVDATNANYATSAGNAATASYATSAGNASTADLATKATQDGNGEVISDTYEKIQDRVQTLTYGLTRDITTTDSVKFITTGFSRAYTDSIGCAGVLSITVGVDTLTCYFSTLWQSRTYSANVVVPFLNDSVVYHAYLNLKLESGKITVSTNPDGLQISHYDVANGYSTRIIAPESIRFPSLSVYYK